MGVDELLQFVDPEKVDEFRCEYIKAMENQRPRVPAAPRALQGSRIVRSNEKPPTNGERFAEFMHEHFGYRY